jgi:hypothetical protein
MFPDFKKLVLQVFGLAGFRRAVDFRASQSCTFTCVVTGL